ncbi:MAG: SPFH domain-containing protein, partial [Vicinamibacterales bacterium]
MGVVTLPMGRRGGANRDHAPKDVRVNVVAVLVLLIPVALGIAGANAFDSPWPALAGIVAGFTLALSPRVAKQWERAVVLRLGRYVGLRGPGLFWIVPFVESVTKWIDQRVITTSFAA